MKTLKERESQGNLQYTDIESPWKNAFDFFKLLFRATPAADGGSQARVSSELQLPTYTTATAIPTERGQGSNPQPHGS